MLILYELIDEMSFCFSRIASIAPPLASKKNVTATARVFRNRMCSVRQRREKQEKRNCVDTLFLLVIPMV